MKKSLFLFSLALFVVFAVLAFANPGVSKTRSYYSGDAISYNGKVYVGSTNSGYLEVLRVDNGYLTQIAKMKSYNARFNQYEDFFDLQFNVEGGRLYVYAINGYTLYKYELLSNKLELVQENKNTYWEWYTRVEKFGSTIATVSAQGIKIWNNNLEVINSFDYTNKETPHNISGSNDYYFTNINGDYLEIYSREERKIISSTALNFLYKNNHATYQDADFNTYVVDDYYTKKYSLTGQLLGSYRHLDFEGFDVSSSANGYVYFSNGMGVVKLLAEDMSERDYAYTYNLGGIGGWAMGLKVVNNNGYDTIVIFNSTNILVLDHKLNKVASIMAQEEEDPYPMENLYLNLDYNKATKGAEVIVSGGGFLPYENLSINFADRAAMFEASADSHGRFDAKLIVPEKQGMVDIKVDGKTSKLTYSISFEIVKPN